MNQNLPKFSVLISVYAGDRLDYFKKAMDSVYDQTAIPDEIVLVKDGPVSVEIDDAINEYKQKTPSVLKVVAIEKNQGLGAALAQGLAQCSYDIIARMDADDISVSQRFEKQLKFLKGNPDIDVVSCFVAAFDKDPQKPLFFRRGPLEPEQIAQQFRFRFCMNHPASMMRKSAIIKAGNYIPFDGLEDYHLWARMLMAGARMANIGEALYYHRWDKGLVKRRGGLKRAALQIRLQREFLRIGFINKWQFLRNVAVRTTAAILPTRVIMRLRIRLGI